MRQQPNKQFCPTGFWLIINRKKITSCNSTFFFTAQSAQVWPTYLRAIHILSCDPLSNQKLRMACISISVARLMKLFYSKLSQNCRHCQKELAIQHPFCWLHEPSVFWFNPNEISSLKSKMRLFAWMLKDFPYDTDSLRNFKPNSDWRPLNVKFMKVCKSPFVLLTSFSWWSSKLYISNLCPF